jgi:hypothetical protein
VTAGYEFDIPVRFDTDRIEIARGLQGWLGAERAAGGDQAMRTFPKRLQRISTRLRPPPAMHGG